MIKFTKNYTIDELDEKVNEILKNRLVESKLSFSMFETLNDSSDDLDGWKVRAPNLDSKKPVFEGKCKFYVTKSFFSGGYTSKTYLNPTWNDIIFEANNGASGDHRFLEILEERKVLRGIKYIEMWFGS